MVKSLKIQIFSKVNWKGVKFPLSKQKIGSILVVLAALALVINISFFKQNEWFDIVRWISIAVFAIGILLIPTYSKPKSNG